MADMMDGIDLEKIHPRECPFCGEEGDNLQMWEDIEAGGFRLLCGCGGTMMGNSVREVLDAWDSRV